MSRSKAKTNTLPDLSIVIPAYNEGPEFAKRLTRLAKFLATRDYGKVEVLIVLQLAGQPLPDYLKRFDLKQFADGHMVDIGDRAGKGGAVRAGMLLANGRYRLFMDADLATPLEHLDDVYSLMQRGGQVGIGVRHLWSMHDDLLRKLVTQGGNVLVRLVLLPTIEDSQCGFKVFTAEATERIFGRVTVTGWGFDLEVLALARKFGYKIETFFAAGWRDPKPFGLVGDTPLHAALQVFRDMFKIRFKLWLGRYKQETFRREDVVVINRF